MSQTARRQPANVNIQADKDENLVDHSEKKDWTDVPQASIQAVTYPFMMSELLIFTNNTAYRL